MMTNKEKNFVSAVIYVHNAEHRIEDFLSEIIKVMEKNFEHSEIICVNDCSEDETLDKIKKVSKTACCTSVSVVNMSYFHGLEMAMNAGADLSIGDFVFEFDNTNMDFDSSVIMDIYYLSLKGFDIVSAVPNKKERFTSRIFYKVFSKLTDMSYEMSTESFRILSRRVINRISSMNKMIPYRKAIYANCGLKTNSIKYETKTIENGKLDKSEQRYRTGLAIDTLIIFTDAGYQFSKAMSLLMIGITVAMLAYTAVAYAFSNPVEGWTSTILFLAIAFFGVFSILTIMLKYLQILVGLVFKRKHYNFESIEKLTK